MSDVKHTPGPWSFYDCAAYGSHITRGGIGGQMIASVQQYVGISADAYKANRALIAAAPELLAALEFYADPLRYEGPNTRRLPGDPYVADHDYRIDVTRDGGAIARAAIAKARGA